MEVIIDLKKANKEYIINSTYKIHALQEIDFQVTKGEFVAIVGPSGSGKSTLLNIIGCLDNLTNGSYIFAEQEVTKYSNKQMANHRNEKIGFVLQEFGLMGDMSVFDNVSIPLLLSNIPYRYIKNRITEVLNILNINNLSNRKTKELSGGQRQRVAIARSIVMKPEVLLADEPTGALDSNTAGDMLEIFHMLNADGMTILMVTHNEQLAEHCASKYRLVDGRLNKEKRYYI